VSGAQGDYSRGAGPGRRSGAVTILIIRGGLTLGAGTFDSVLRGEALVSAGGVLILGMSLKLLNLVDVNVGNFLPALVIAPGLVGIVSLVN
jgi:uncharacterized membrane protein YqgA involved in biofilm formation